MKMKCLSSILAIGCAARSHDVPRLTYILYDGLVPRLESGEYVEITSAGDQPQDLAGWVLMRPDIAVLCDSQGEEVSREKAANLFWGRGE